MKVEEEIHTINNKINSLGTKTELLQQSVNFLKDSNEKRDKREEELNKSIVELNKSINNLTKIYAEQAGEKQGRKYIISLIWIFVVTSIIGTASMIVKLNSSNLVMAEQISYLREKSKE